MKILLLCWRDTTHPQGGGSERYLEHVAGFLSDQGHEVIYRTAAHTEYPRTSVRDGIVFSRAGGKFGVYPRAAIMMLLGRCGIGSLAGVDVVVDTQNGIPFFGKLFTNKPTILLTHHCHREQWPVVGPVLARVGWWIESRLSPRIHRDTPVVTVSDPSKEELIELGFAADNIEIIRNGVDPVPDQLPIIAPDGYQHVVTLSRLVPHKQIEHAIDAVHGLDNVKLDVIGSGWWEDQLHDYVSAIGATDQVVFHGQVTEDYKHALLARADIHLMPSRKEGWGLAVIEAAQHRVPTVGYHNSGGLRDSIDDGTTGVLVHTPRQLRGVVTQLLNDATRRRELGRAAQLKAAGFSWSETGRLFAAKIADVANATGTSNHDPNNPTPHHNL